MSHHNVSPELLEISLPGAWIAEHQRIWQMNFLNADKLATFSHDRGLASFNAKDVTQLWQLGLIKADIVISRRKLSLDGLINRSTDKYGQHIYSDERQLPQQLNSWENARENLKPLHDEIGLLFHPFRYYVVYHLNRALGLNISRMQMLYQDGFSRLLNWNLSSFNNWSSSEQFILSIKKWNDVASLGIVTEPCTYVRIFKSIRYDPSEVKDYQRGEEEIYQHIEEYWNSVNALYQHIGVERLEDIRKEICFDTQILDPNRWIHTQLCLGQEKFRTELEGHLGGAMLLRTMAEMIRRATERAFDVTLREEDELGFGLVPENVKRELYGSNRLLDGDESAAKEFMRQYELDYGLRLRVYVEGPTEWEALRYAFQTIGAQHIEVINLAGEVAQKRGKGVAFRENLRSDIAMHVFSMVLIDDDRKDFVSAVKKAAQDDEICGCFYIAKQDFEFANFELSELEEILWEWAIGEDSEKELTETDRNSLHEAIKDSENAVDLIKHAKKALVPLNNISKGERWGRKLIDFAGKYPIKQGKQRQIVEVVQMAIRAKMANYKITRQEYKVDKDTGQPIKRAIPLIG